MNQHEFSKHILLFESTDLARTFREWKSPLLSVEFVFIKTFEELNSADKELLEKEKEFEFFNVEMKTKWDKLKNRQSDFLSNLAQYDFFFRENEKKMSRILGKITSKMKLRQQFIENINVLEDRDTFVTNAEQKLEISVQQLKPFDEFLEKIIQNMKNFDQVVDLINHYMLLNSETLLLEKLHRNIINSKSTNNQISQLLKLEMTNFLDQNTEIFILNAMHRSKVNQEKVLKVEVRKQMLSNEKNLSNIVILRHSCSNIYLKLLKWQKTKFPKRIDCEDKYSFIIDTANELKEAVDLARRLFNKAVISSKADSSFVSPRRIV